VTELKSAWGKLFVILITLLLATGCDAGPGTGASSDTGTASEDQSTYSSSGTSPESSTANVSKPIAAVAPAKTKQRVPGVPAKVVKVVDGDTLDVIYQKKVTTVRVLLIDTPETHHPVLGVQPYGPEASAYAHQLLDGKTVNLEVAVNGGRDKYGRLLAYVFVDGKSYEGLQLSKGLARVAYIIPPNTRYLDQYQADEAAARQKKLNIWSVGGYARSDGFHPEVMKGTTAYKEIHQNASSTSSSSAQKAVASVSGGFAPDSLGNCGGAIKGNISARGKIYHIPSERYYKATKAEVCFKTRTAAASAGFRASRAK
jgi:Micrococcal nuclease (thermonuclease) homologs